MRVHILFVPSWYPSPEQPLMGTFHEEQAAALAETGLSVGVLAPRFHDLPSSGWLKGPTHPITSSDERKMLVIRAAQRLRQPGPLQRIPSIYRASVRQRVRLGQKMFEAYVKERGRPDLIHGHSVMWGGVIATEIARTNGLPSVITESASIFSRGIAGPRERITAAAAYRNSDKCLVLSRTLADDLRRILHLDDIEFGLSPFMVDSDHFPLAESPSRTTGFRWLTVGNLVADKGHDTLLHAFSELRDESTTLTIVGGGGLSENLKQLSTELGLSEKVQFLGQVSREDIPQLFANSHALVHPSRFETQGIVLIEALATGRPVVATRCGGPESTIREEDGILVDIDDAAGLALAMAEMMQREWDHQELRAGALARFGRQKIIEDLVSVYQSLI